MYFQFLKSMTVCLFLMTILSVPCIVFAFSGDRIPVTERDITNLYMLTLGNIGYNPASPTYTIDSTCKSVSPTGVNETCIHVFGLEYSLVNASSVLTACEILQILVFFITICHVHRKTLRFEKENDRLFTSVTSYAVMVLNVPHDCAPDELVLHFSHLYPLDGPDWRGRPALMGARPVQSVSKVLVRLCPHPSSPSYHSYFHSFFRLISPSFNSIIFSVNCPMGGVSGSGLFCSGTLQH